MVRLNLRDDTYQKLLDTVKDFDLISELKSGLDKSIKKANETKIKIAKQKIRDTIEFLTQNNKNISRYAIAKHSGLSISTVRKYYDEFKIDILKAEIKISLNQSKNNNLTPIMVIK